MFLNKEDNMRERIQGGGVILVKRQSLNVEHNCQNFLVPNGKFYTQWWKYICEKHLEDLSFKNIFIFISLNKNNRHFCNLVIITIFNEFHIIIVYW